MTAPPGPNQKRGTPKLTRLKRIPDLFSSRYLFLVVLCLLLDTASGLIDDPVANRTFIKPYGPAVVNEHTSFDMSILDGTSLVQADG